jgi:hypothetical protein
VALLAAVIVPVRTKEMELPKGLRVGPATEPIYISWDAAAGPGEMAFYQLSAHDADGNEIRESGTAIIQHSVTEVRR